MAKTMHVNAWTAKQRLQKRLLRSQSKHKRISAEKLRGHILDVGKEINQTIDELPKEFNKWLKSAEQRLSDGATGSKASFCIKEVLGDIQNIQDARMQA